MIGRAFESLQTTLSVADRVREQNVPTNAAVLVSGTRRHYHFQAIHPYAEFISVGF
jgi:hypothetical protein